ncbi:ESX secretion-associated protein EspG [Amycolatopsis benzoatilytica]|uniref:ESX secretion-associated protein EspG n=1 Tax=Amycolatopsis benzoatilytica TaxID=346045 RepID=UPI00036030D3|nr:ESX secretion-associated protein EspG [Amycolatopsis benzoatilytica]
MTIINGPLRLPRPVFLALWRAEGLGRTPVVVEDTPMYLTGEGAAELAKRTEDLLAQLGEPVAAAVRGTLRLLASARQEVYSWTDFAAHQDDNGAILVAASGREAIRLIADDQYVQLDPVSPNNLVASLVLAMPDYPPAAIRPMRVPREYYDGGGAADLLDEDSGHAEEIRYLMRAPREAVHLMHAAVRDDRGARRYSPALSVVDLPERGRVLSYQDTQNGAPEISVAPGNRPALIDAVGRALAGLR